eukprot:11865995-Alexandrium_andersonii.AAC.1
MDPTASSVRMHRVGNVYKIPFVESLSQVQPAWAVRAVTIEDAEPAPLPETLEVMELNQGWSETLEGDPVFVEADPDTLRVLKRRADDYPRRS